MTPDEKKVIEFLDIFSGKTDKLTFSDIPIDNLNLPNVYWRKIIAILWEQLKMLEKNHESAMKTWELCREARR